MRETLEKLTDNFLYPLITQQIIADAVAVGTIFYTYFSPHWSSPEMWDPNVHCLMIEDISVELKGVSSKEQIYNVFSWEIGINQTLRTTPVATDLTGHFRVDASRIFPFSAVSGTGAVVKGAHMSLKRGPAGGNLLDFNGYWGTVATKQTLKGHHGQLNTYRQIKSAVMPHSPILLFPGNCLLMKYYATGDTRAEEAIAAITYRYIPK